MPHLRDAMSHSQVGKLSTSQTTTYDDNICTLPCFDLLLDLWVRKLLDLESVTCTSCPCPRHQWRWKVWHVPSTDCEYYCTTVVYTLICDKLEELVVVRNVFAIINVDYRLFTDHAITKAVTIDNSFAIVAEERSGRCQVVLTVSFVYLCWQLRTSWKLARCQPK